MGRNVDMERRRLVWQTVAMDPTLSGAEVAEKLGLAERTVQKDIKAAEGAVNDRAASAIRAGVIERNFMLIGVYLPMALTGDHKAADVIFKAHKELREVYKLDPDTEMTVNYRHIIERVATNTGLSVDEVMDEAKRILAEASAAA